MVIQDTADISVSRAAELLGVSRSGYYKWIGRLKRSEDTDGDDMELRNLIQKIVIEFLRYGYRRVTAALRNLGYAVNHKKVLNLMREDNLLCVKKTFKPVTTNSKHNHRKYPNLTKDLEVSGINHVWGCRHHLHPIAKRVCLPGSNN